MSSDNRMNIVKTKNLTKQWGNIVAVDHVNFEIKEGEIFGFLGPNGAGKTTTIKMLCTLLNPTDGTATIAEEFDILQDPAEVRRCVGYVPQDITVDGRLTARENLEFQASLYGIPRGKEREEKIEQMLKLVELGQRADGLVEMFSGGMRRRLEIARGLLVEPILLLLDEPSVGLDPVSRKSIWGHVNKLKKKYRDKFAILMSTHYMEEADRLCDRIAIIDRGVIVALDTPKNLKRKIGGQVVEIDVEKGRRAAKRFEKEDKSFIINVKELSDQTVAIEVNDGESAAPKIFKIASENKIDIKSMRIREPSLEDVFIHYTGKTLRDEDTDLISFVRRQFSKRMRSL
ncbi:MAG: ATP-binding cassette domain-containing protein [Candidatus Lokiarchaeota archaeon]|nr:ATP-binding cassette domain-containing protein [Candidatus Lokiarchaeota archaeon]